MPILLNGMNLDSLLISRDEALAAVLTPALERISVRLKICGNLERACDLLAKSKFDAVIIDCDYLPQGVDLLKGLRQTQSNSKSVSFAVLKKKRPRSRPSSG